MGIQNQNIEVSRGMMAISHDSSRYDVQSEDLEGSRRIPEIKQRGISTEVKKYARLEGTSDSEKRESIRWGNDFGVKFYDDEIRGSERKPFENVSETKTEVLGRL